MTRPVTISLDAAMRIARSELAPEQVEELRAAVSYANPARASVAARGECAWWLPERLSSVVEDDHHFVIPRGATRLVRQALGAVTWIDRRLELPSIDVRLGVDLRPHQAAARDALARRHQGLAVMPPGAGKTITGLALVAHHRQPALVIVGSVDLLEQWRAEVRSRLGMEPGIIGGGETSWADVTIATWQSLERIDVLEEATRRFGLVLVDEAHHVAATVLAGLVHALPAKYRYGLSATPNRADGLGVLLEHFIGPTAFEIGYAELAEAGLLTVPEYVQVASMFTARYASRDDWPALLEALVTDPGRNALVADVAARECADGDVGLVLTGRVAHVEELAHLIGARGRRVAGITGRSSAAERRRALDGARSGELDVLVATSIADEGLDLPRLSRVVLAFPQRNEGRLLQRIGRALRPHEGKGGARILDITDPCVGVLRAQARTRASIVVSTWGPGAVRRAA